MKLKEEDVEKSENIEETKCERVQVDLPLTAWRRADVEWLGMMLHTSRGQLPLSRSRSSA